MARPRGQLPEANRRAIARRLSKFLARYRTRKKVEEALGVPPRTISQWGRKQNPVTPETYYLIQMGEETKLNLNWLLLGEGSELRPEHSAPEVDALSSIVAELRATESAELADHDEVWAQFQANAEELLKRAADALRPEYRDILRRLRFARLEQRIEDAFPAGPLAIGESAEDLKQALRDLERADK